MKLLICSYVYFELGGKDDALKQTYEQIKSFIEGQRGGK
jgi:hypothetical protein